jgi:peptide-methionine (S)-S-oxide reductase
MHGELRREPGDRTGSINPGIATYITKGFAMNRKLFLLLWIPSILAVGILVAGLYFTLFSSREEQVAHDNFPTLTSDDIGVEPIAPTSGTELATFGSGCFWCTEAVFQEIKGVKQVVSGYSGGTLVNPSYRDVCEGKTGHAEVVQVAFDPTVVSYPELLEVFWRSHDPTSINRQGHDSGTQYRSVIFYHSDRQQQLAARYKKMIDEAGVFTSPVATQIAPYVAFYPAESNHQNYYADHPNEMYCRMVINPKIEKLRKVFHDRLKAE